MHNRAINNVYDPEYQSNTKQQSSGPAYLLFSIIREGSDAGVTENPTVPSPSSLYSTGLNSCS